MANGRRKVTVEITGDSGSFDRATKRTIAKAGLLGGAFAAVGAKITNMAADAGQALGRFAVDSVKAAIKDEASQSKLAQTLKKTQGARKADVAGVEKWIDATSRASGVADDDLRPALSKLLVAGDSVKQSQRDVALAMDVSAATGKSLESVSAALAKAHNGNIGALGRLGIATKDADGKTLSLKKIQENLAKQMGGASAKAAETTQGKMKRLSVAFNEAKESIGAKLLPILLKMADWILDKGIPALQGMWHWFQEKILPTLKNIAGSVMEGVRSALKSIGDAIERNKPQLQALWEGFKKVADFIVTKVAPLYGKYLKFLFTAIGKGFAFVIDSIGMFIRWAPKIINNFIRPVVGAFLTFVSFMVGAAAKAFGWVPGIGPKLKRAKEAIDKFKADADRALDALAISMGHKGDKAGTSFAKSFARGLAKADGVSISVGNQKATQLVNVNLPPGLAKGGMVTRAGSVLVGEAGPELLNLNRGASVTPLSRAGGGDTYVTINVTALAANSAEVGKAAMAGLRAYKNAGGRVMALP